MCVFFVLLAWFLAASINLWTSGMYDRSSLDNLYIQKDLSIITCKIMTLWTSGIVINAKQVTIYIYLEIFISTF
jgi:hypothetical protein